MRSPKPITPKQVQLLEAFVQQEMGQPFKLIFMVNQVEEVTRNSQRQTPVQATPKVNIKS